MVFVIEVVDDPKYIKSGGTGKSGVLVVGNENGCLIRFLLMVK
mgnify:CR=1 FL=1|jgi:hypothetical protein